MKDKERLLSLDEPVAFIFSHSALREGWDNPNVCQICTLNQTVSEMKKRQEVGRGMRLVVNQQGQRNPEEKVNILTVVANESYEEFVSTLQAEMVEAFGEAGAAPKPVNAREKHIAKRKPLDALPEEFAVLWEKIRPKTRYQVTVDTEKLIKDVVERLDRVKIEAPRIVASKAEVTVDKDKDLLDYRLFGHGVLATVASPAGRPEHRRNDGGSDRAHHAADQADAQNPAWLFSFASRIAKRRWIILRSSLFMRPGLFAKRRLHNWSMESSTLRMVRGMT